MAPNLLKAATLALRASSAAVCPALPACPQDDQCLFTNNGVTLQVSCATDYYGGDVALAQASTLAGCLTACSRRSDCVAASYVGQNCYMKSTLNPGSANANVIGVAVASRPPPTSTPPATSQPQTCPSGFTCPQDDGCLYTSGSRTLTLSCGVDFYGGDLANQYAASLEACTQACAANTECVAASFVGGNGAGTCYLKSTKNDGSDNDNVNGVYVVTTSAASSLSATSATSTTSSSTMISSAASSTDTSSSTAISSTASSTDISSSSPSNSIPAATSSSVDIPSSTLLSSSTAASSTSQVISSSSSTLPTDSSSSIASSTTDASSTDSSSSTIASTSTTSATSSPSPTSVVSDGGFEATESIPWSIRITHAGALTYNFANSDSSHSGAQAGSISYNLAAGAQQSWFAQPINLQPNTRYDLSAWSKASAANPACNVYFYIGAVDGTVLKIMASILVNKLGTSWTQATGFYDSGATGGAVTFNVRLTCNRAAAMTYYVDDISLVPA